MLHHEETVVVLLQDGHELKEGVGQAHVPLCDVPVQAAGYATDDKEDLLSKMPSLWSR